MSSRLKSFELKSTFFFYPDLVLNDGRQFTIVHFNWIGWSHAHSNFSCNLRGFRIYKTFLSCKTTRRKKYLLNEKTNRCDLQIFQVNTNFEREPQENWILLSPEWCKTFSLSSSNRFTYLLDFNKRFTFIEFFWLHISWAFFVAFLQCKMNSLCFWQANSIYSS